MKKMDKDGMLLCELQAKTFELSLKLTETSSEIFIRRFMNSDVVKELDNTSFLETNLQPKDIIEYMHDERAYMETKPGEIIPFSLAKEIKAF